MAVSSRSGSRPGPLHGRWIGRHGSTPRSRPRFIAVHGTRRSRVESGLPIRRGHSAAGSGTRPPLATGELVQVTRGRPGARPRRPRSAPRAPRRGGRNPQAADRVPRDAPPPTSRRTRSPSASTTVRGRAASTRRRRAAPGRSATGTGRRRRRGSRTPTGTGRHRTMSGETRNTARGVGGRAHHLMVPRACGGRHLRRGSCRASQHPGTASHWFDAAPRRTLNLRACPSAVPRTSQARRRLRTSRRRRATLVPPHPGGRGVFSCPDATQS